MIIFIAGFGMIFLISCLMNYQVGLVESLLICAIGYLITRTFIRNLWTSIISLVIMVVIGALGSYVLFRLDAINPLWEQILDFFEPYYLSINQNNDLAIDIFRQGVVIWLISVGVYKVWFSFKNHWITNKIFYSISFACCIIGFLMGTLTSSRDFRGFLIIFACMVLQYFYKIYQLKKHELHSFLPYLILCAIFIFTIYGFANMFYSIQPRPLHMPEKKASAISSTALELTEFEAPIIEKIEVNQNGTISNEFFSEGKELFRVQGSIIEYFRGKAYDTYHQGVWEISEEGASYFEEITINPWEFTETVQVKYTQMRSDILYIGDCDLLQLKVPESIQVLRDDDYNTYKMTVSKDTPPNEAISYSFEGMVPNQSNGEYLNALKAANHENLPFDFQNSKYVFPEGYEDIRDLAKEITKDAKNDFVRIQMIRKYFVDHFTYTTSPDVQGIGDTDFIRYFLFTSHEGFCQHFASAEVLMLQSLGIPARYVVGFKVPEIPDDLPEYMSQGPYGVDGFRVISDSQAHAWFEVYFPGIGWQMFEATPGFAPIIEDTFIENNEIIIAENKQNEMQLSSAILLIILTILILGLLVIGTFQLIQKKRSFVKQSPTYRIGVDHRIILEYFKLLNKPKQPHETVFEYSKRIDGWMKTYGQEALFQKVIPLYEKVIYGDYELTEEEMQPYVQYKKYVYKFSKQQLGRLKCLKVQLKEFIISF